MSKLSNDFLDYLVGHPLPETDSDPGGTNGSHLPSLSVLSKELGLSVALLREQLEVAKAIGLVEVRPRTGIRRLPYSFLPAVRQSLSFAIASDWSYFTLYADLRIHIETAYWNEATRKLTSEDHAQLQDLLASAWNKLRGNPSQIPHEEHRLLHLSIYRKLENPFVIGLLEAYWEAYEAVGLNLYADYRYLEQVWQYHQRMVEAICQGDYEGGYQALVQHKDLLFHRPRLAAAEEVRRQPTDVQDQSNKAV